MATNTRMFLNSAFRIVGALSGEGNALKLDKDVLMYGAYVPLV